RTMRCRSGSIARPGAEARREYRAAQAAGLRSRCPRPAGGCGPFHEDEARGARALTALPSRSGAFGLQAGAASRFRARGVSSMDTHASADIDYATTPDVRRSVLAGAMLGVALMA